MILHLIRHGETQHNKDGVGLGREDAPLTELGREQVRAVAERFRTSRLDAVLSSPLRRAFDTAEAVAEAHGLIVEPREALLELHVGDTEAMPFAEVRQRWPEFAEQWIGPKVADAVMPGGESLRQLAHRLAPLIDEFRARPAEDAVAVVSHNFVIKVLLCELLGMDLGSFRAFDVGLASVSTVSLRGPRTAVVTLNDTCHLHGLNLDPAQRRL